MIIFVLLTAKLEAEEGDGVLKRRLVFWLLPV